MRSRLARSYVALVVWLPLVAACSAPPAATDPRTEPPVVRVAAVRTAAAEGRSFTGVVASRIQSDLGFRVSGKVLERLVDAGQSVRRGQPLMRMDPVDLSLATRAQQEAVIAASARAKQASDDEARYRDLVSAGAVSASTYDKVKAAAESARADLNGVTAQADVARNASGYAALVADADGVVVETLAEPGQVVGAGQVVIRLARAGRREAVIDLPETLRPALGSAAQARLYAGGAAAPATLRQLSDAANRVTRTFEARYVLEGRLAAAPLGSTIVLELANSGSSPALQVPIGALADPGTGTGVWLVAGDDTPRVTWRPVRVVRLGNETATVDGQLNTGDRIVALGAHLLHEGMTVRVTSGSSDSGARASEGGRQ